MAGPYNPPKKNQAAIYYVSLSDPLVPGSYKANPTIATSDWKVSQDGGALTDLGTNPSVSPAGSVMLKITLTASELNGDNVTIVGIDQTTPKEWDDFVLNIVTSA